MKPSILWIVLAAVGLSACQTPVNTPEYFTPGADDTKQSLEVPPDLTGLSSGNRYSLPPGAVRSSDLATLPTEDQAAKVDVLPTVEHMRIEREGSARWLEVDNLTPNELWTKLESFWQNHGFVIEEARPEIGFMRTAWAERRNPVEPDMIHGLLQKVGLGSLTSTGIRDRFIIRIERQKNQGSAVTFSHNGMIETFADRSQDTLIWKMRPADPNLEAQFLAEFMLSLGVDEKTVQTLQENSTPTGKMLAKKQGDTVWVYGTHERNRYRLMLALNRMGLTVQSYDAEQSGFHVIPAQDEVDGNKSTFSWFKSKKPAEKALPQKLFVTITPQQEGDSISIRAEAGQEALDAKQVEQWLDGIYQQLR